MSRTPADSHRLSILTAEEIEDLYGVPSFTDEDRHFYFDLSAPERTAVDAHTASVAAHLIFNWLRGFLKVKLSAKAHERWV